ncbi:hypothetical protein [Streptosporangium sp. NPDC087985]|uniref:hypothetical protein n=1 Tax=Streptosporangium sp. NPDC087985 TaxID=3366196 RepID=UPI0037FDD135
MHCWAASETGNYFGSSLGFALLGVVAAVIFAGLAVLILTMRPATRTTPAALPNYEATRSTMA